MSSPSQKKAQWKNKKFAFLFHSPHVQVLSAWETNTEEHLLKKAPVENLLYAISHNHNAAQTGAKLKSQRQLHSLLNHMLIVFFLKIAKHTSIIHYCQSLVRKHKTIALFCGTCLCDIERLCRKKKIKNLLFHFSLRNS